MAGSLLLAASLVVATAPRGAVAQEVALLAGISGSLTLLDVDAAPVSSDLPLVEARLAPQGYPEPSIIVGAIAPERRAAFGLAPQAGIDWDDADALADLRDAEPGDFATLVAAGAFDPPADENLAVLLQTRLAEMDCYRAGIDGLWGGGSTGAAALYFETLGQPVPDGVSPAEPSVALYRAVLVGGAVTCPVPQVASAPAPQPPAATAPRVTQPRPVRQAAQPPPQPPASSGSSRGFGIGVTTR